MSDDNRSLHQEDAPCRTHIKRAEADIKVREDRIGKYFRKYLDRFVFAEFSGDFLKRYDVQELMSSVPVPLRQEEIQGFAGGEGSSAVIIGENMAWVMGSDPHFRYTENYAGFLDRISEGSIREGLVKKAGEAAERGELDNACIHFRAALCIASDDPEAVYGYARTCREMYLASSNEEYTGRFKAESMEWFELLTEMHPDFAQGYYYLGYAYMNIGLYAKADIAWRSFVRLSSDSKERKEIQMRLAQLADPLRIEKGCNEILAGRYESGISALEPFIDTRFGNWWPLYYYLGIAYEMMGRTDEAVSSLKKVLTLNGSHIETMKELLSIYEAQGDTENIRKYSRKIEMVELNLSEEQDMHIKAIREEDRKLQN